MNTSWFISHYKVLCKYLNIFKKDANVVTNINIALVSYLLSFLCYICIYTITRYRYLVFVVFLFKPLNYSTIITKICNKKIKHTSNNVTNKFNLNSQKLTTPSNHVNKFKFRTILRSGNARRARRGWTNQATPIETPPHAARFGIYGAYCFVVFGDFFVNVKLTVLWKSHGMETGYYLLKTVSWLLKTGKN